MMEPSHTTIRDPDRPPLPDQPARDAFAAETDRSFAVVASAGSGKTTAIVNRIAALAARPDAESILPRLVMVTYTKAAAEEMQQRAREMILGGTPPPSPGVVDAFNRAFFGTIHSFCVLLLDRYGHFIGVPPRLDNMEADDPLWLRFRQEINAEMFPPEIDFDLLAKHVRMVRLIDAACKWPPGMTAQELPPPYAEPDLTPALEFAGFRSQSKATGAAEQERLRAWAKTPGYRGIPVIEKGGATFVALCSELFAPLREWRSKSAALLAARLAEEYSAFRIREGGMKFDDQVMLAHRLLSHPEALQRIRTCGYRVLLDEGQDTDPMQFELLFQIACDPVTKTLRPGHFCVVGDPQQSIYWKRADLTKYEQIRGQLDATLTFSATMRCSEKVIDCVNAIFPHVLTGTSPQSAYTELHPRPAVTRGQVLRFTPTWPEEWTETPRSAAALREEARQLAHWIKLQGIAGLHARSWSQVAVIHEQKAVLEMLAVELRHAGIAVRILSDRETNADSPAFCWLTALLLIMASPRDAWEIAGVLREVYGMPDAELGAFVLGESERLRLDLTPPAKAPAALHELAEIHAEIKELPLRDLVHTLITHTRLRERLQCLPLPGPHEQEVAALLALATAAENDGLTAWEFAQQLVARKSAARAQWPGEEDAVQIVTAHKAKGSQWDVVILPGLARANKIPSDGFPRIEGNDLGLPPCIGCDKNDGEGSEKDAVLRNRDRLLYVCFTRARETLLLVDDLPFFAGKKGNAPDNSALTRLQLCPEFNSLFVALPESGAPQTLQPAPNANPKPSSPTPLPSLMTVDRNHLLQARAHALQFTGRTSPHQLSHPPGEEDPEALLERIEMPAVLPGGTRYGSWWHALMEQISWSGAPEEMEKVFQCALLLCPAKERAEKEWKALLASPVPPLLAAPGLLHHSEIQFLRAVKSQSAQEGFMDLAVFNPLKKKWLVLDWKTDRVTDPEELCRRYSPQLLAYADALTELTRHPADAALYSTFQGTLLPLG